MFERLFQLELLRLGSVLSTKLPQHTDGAGNYPVSWKLELLRT